MLLQSALACVMPFGKHKGLTLDEILDESPSYLQWLIEEGVAKGFLADALVELDNQGLIEDAIEEKRGH